MTLTIIGVIAGLTIPALQKNIRSREFAGKLKKTYSILSQATDLVEANYAPMSRWNGTIAKEEYKKHLNIVKECPPESGCFYNSNIIYPDGHKDVNYGDAGWVLADGMVVKPAGIGALFTTPPAYGMDPAEKVMGAFYVDMNGTYQPNQWGTDVFLLILVPGKGLVPTGAYSTALCKAAYGCASKVITEGKIEY